MTNFESIFRPFAQIGVTPPLKDNTVGPATPVSNVILRAGKNGQTKAFSGSFSSNETFYMDAVHTEKAHSPSRETHIKRVFKDNDPVNNPDIWVDIEVIDKIWVRGPNGQYVQWKFVPPNP